MTNFGKHQENNAAFIKIGHEEIRLMQMVDMTEPKFFETIRPFAKIHHPEGANAISDDNEIFKGKLNQYVPGLCELEKLIHWDFVWTSLPSGKKQTYYPPKEVRELYEQGFISNPIYCDRVAKQKPTIWTTDIVKKIQQTNGDDGEVEKLLDNLEGMIK